MDEPRIDLSALDPGRDPERLERMVQAVLARSGRAHAHPFASEVVSRGRIAVAAALAAAALAWVPALAGRPEAAAPAKAETARRDVVSTVAAWAAAGEIPSGTDVYGVLGASDER